METQQWMPAGKLLEPIGNSADTNVVPFEFHNKMFKTKDEADNYFINYYIIRGYTQEN